MSLRSRIRGVCFGGRSAGIAILLKYKQIFILCLLAIALFATTAPIGPNDLSRYLSIVSLAKGEGLVIDQGLQQADTMDKILIKGHFYSDKPPLFALTFAPIYYGARLSGIALDNKYLYKLAILLIMGTFFALAMTLFYKEYAARFPELQWLLLGLIFATPYYVFNRVLMSHALVGSLLYIAFYLIRKKEGSYFPLWAGLLSGLAITYDNGAGFLFCSFILYLSWNRRWRDLVLLVAASLLPIIIHLLIVYQLSGSWLPLNTHSEYFNYPGSYFANGSGSGNLKFSEPFSLLGYMLALLFIFPFGYLSKGLFLTAPILIFAFIQMGREARAGKAAAFTLLIGILLLFFYYALTSNNLAGGDYAVRWFIIFMPLCLPYVVKYYAAGENKKGWRGWFNFALIVSLLISLLYSFVSWLGGVTPLF
ncbi:MAG: hypothetical protein PHH14_01000 [Candidatus Margulisbacteria bacterium]|nr:hypothetical protein [Candidatus Margulisiibacteriota bacterium]